MSETDKKNQNQDINLQPYDEEEDDLWAVQSTEISSPKQIDFEEEEKVNLDNLKSETISELKQDEEKLDSPKIRNDGEEDKKEQSLKTASTKEISQDFTEELEAENIEKIEKEKDTSGSIIDEINSWLEEDETSIYSGEEKKEEEKTESNLVESISPIIEENKPKNIIAEEDNNLVLEIEQLQKCRNELLKQQTEISANISSLVSSGLSELQQKKQDLEIAIQKLEKRKERIEQEMKTTFAGASQDLAIKVQGFKDYLVGSLQDLAASAEQLELSSPSFQTWESNPTSNPISERQEVNDSPQFTDNTFKQQTKQIRRLLDQYRNRPDYYGSPWQLRRTFEPIHAERVANWFFSLGGRGAIKGMDSRLQNILLASSVISILFNLYGDRSCTLILSDTPERLGEWRRGLQDCLGISRRDFGPNRGVTLFETSEALTQRAQRLVDSGDFPLVIIDQSDDRVSLSLLQFPLWLAFAQDRKPVQSDNYFY